MKARTDRLRGSEPGQNLERFTPLHAFRRFPGFRGFRNSQDREWPVPLRYPSTHHAQQDCDSDTEGEGESDEIPERRKSENKDQRTAAREYEPDETAAEGDLVHGDTGMTVRWHGAPLDAYDVTNTYNTQQLVYAAVYRRGCI